MLLTSETCRFEKVLKYNYKFNQMMDNRTVHISAHDDVFGVIGFAFM